MFTLKSAVIDNSGSSGVLTIVVGVAKTRVVVVGLDLMSAGTTTAQFQDDTGTPVKLTGPYPMTAGTRVNLPLAPVNTGGSGQQGWFATSVGKGLTVNVGSAIQISGVVTYYLDQVA